MTGGRQSKILWLAAFIALETGFPPLLGQEETGSSAAAEIAISAPVGILRLPEGTPAHIPAPRLPAAAQAGAGSSFAVTYLAEGVPDNSPYGSSTCTAWTDPAKAAFQFATATWAPLINSGVPIRINACLANLGSSPFLNYAWISAGKNTPNVPLLDTWYPSALVNSLAGYNFVSGSQDIYITINNSVSWYFGTDGNTPSGKYDLVTVSMQSIFSGLYGSITMTYGKSSCGDDTWGCWGQGLSRSPGVYDRFTENSLGQKLLNTSLFPNPSAQLGAQLTGGNLYFNGPNANAANGGARVKIYAPAPWVDGASYSTLDYNTFKSTPNEFGIFGLGTGTSIHDPGPVVLGLLKDIGWPSVVIQTHRVSLPLIRR